MLYLLYVGIYTETRTLRWGLSLYSRCNDDYSTTSRGDIMYNPVIDGYDQCVLCEDNLMDMGHNPYPLSNEGRACEYCNMVHVIPARIAEINSNKEKSNGIG